MKSIIVTTMAIAALLATSCKRAPKACFNFNKAEYKVGDTMVLINCSTNFTTWHWELPFGAVSHVAEPRIKLGNSGTYQVSLTVATDEGNQSVLGKVTNVAP